MEIKLLNEETISRISAGEVIERPVNVVKELVENSIDAGSTAITVEIRDGGITMIRVTDNGCGIEKDQISRAFVRHATSKINDADDLSRLSSLGFRGEALASIAAVAQVEMITKVRDAVSGTRAVNDHLAAYSPDAPVQIDLEEIGAPDGTTVIVRNLFGKIPVRRRFLRQPQTEAGYITDLIEKQALSHPLVSFHYRVNGQDKLHTSGNGNLRELIYRIYGRETAGAIIPVHAEDRDAGMILDGFIGRPEISRSSRSFETFFINGRMLRSKELSAGLEEGYRTDLMQHRFPFAVLHLTMPPEQVDVNVHPSKMEVRFTDRRAVFRFLDTSVHEALHAVELIPKAGLKTAKEEREESRKEARLKQQHLQNGPHYEAFEKGRTDRTPGKPAVSFRAKDQSAAADPVPVSKLPGSVKPSADTGSYISKTEDKMPVTEEPDGFVFEDRRSFGTEADTSAPDSSRGSFRGGFSGSDSILVSGSNAGSDPDVKSGSCPDVKSGSVPGFKSGSCPDVKSGSVPDVKSGSDPDVRPDSDPDINPGFDPDRNSGVPSGQESPPTNLTGEQLTLEDLFSASAAPDPSAPESFAPEPSASEPSASKHAADNILTREKAARYKYIGQVFGTYWIIEYEKQLLIIDQHAAHEKVNYERMMRRILREHPALDDDVTAGKSAPEGYLALDRLLSRDRGLNDNAARKEVYVASQQLYPPIVLKLSGREESAYRQFHNVFAAMGYEIEDFGGGSYAIRAVPTELFGQTADSLLREILDEIMNERVSGTPRVIISKVASMSCKAAVKGNSRLSETEARALIDELLTLDNPYHCPHGRPTMIVMSQHEMDRKFRRVI